LAEELDNLATAGKLYYNCAQIYKRTGDVEKSNHFLYRSVHCAQMQHDTDLLVVSLNGLSTGYRNINQLDSAVYYASLSEKLIQDGSSSGSKFSHYLNKGLLNMQLGDHQKALQAFLDTRPYVTVAVDEITLLINIAEEYKNLRNSEKALAYFNEALALSEKSKTYNNLAYISYAIAKIYEDRGNYKKFSEMIHLHLNYKDSNDKYIRVQQIHQQQLEFDYERKQVADSLRFLHKESLKNSELEVAAARLSREKSFRLMLVVVLVIIILFSVFISNRFLLTRRQKQIIERQKQIVELKNREIFDSINYAKRLQAAILPQLTNIQKELNLDILYLPKDIIGGDFYFYEKYQDFVFFAVCDCTGHGIPGALMSVVCHHALQKSIREFNLTEPGLILTKAREIVIDSLNAHQQSIKDGMDCSLIAINKRSKKISWAGANNHVWIVNSGILHEIKADKQPVAYYENAREFVTQELPVTAGSLLYLFTDGYGDQFGGPKGKKYKNKSLKDFLQTISGESVEKQVELLQRNFTDWKRELDQVDDVAIGVIRV
jgi:serine phosphatase RsbU (regulator of sigma subunit)